MRVLAARTMSTKRALVIGIEKLPNNFLVRLSDEFRKEWFVSLAKTKGYKQLAKEVGISSSYIYHLKNGRHCFRLSLLKKFVESNGIELKDMEKRIVELVSNRGAHVRLKLPVYQSKELSSIIGHCFGDGSISTSKRQFDYVNTKIELIERVKSLTEGIFHTSSISESRNRDGSYKVTFSTIIGEILAISGGPVGKKVESRLSIPRWIKFGDKEIKKAFLQAVFDDGGSVMLTKDYLAKNINLHFTRIKKNKRALIKLLNEIKELLYEFGIKAHGPYVARKYIVNGTERVVMGIVISDLTSIIQFSDTIGFTQPERACKLSNLLLKFGGDECTKKERHKKSTGNR